ncbi:hypothetical protein FB192DRAFT_1448179 [Mucor lusitanicus]|nr:hypothetical protein FB192DRAFT_1448179 [Mucor lusitanicus]
MCPEIFFSDDTAGGNSKQFLPYESWSMVHAALPYEDRARRENTKYLRCVPKSEGLSSMSFIPSIAADLKMLKRGVKMHSSVFVEIVIVKAPLTFYNPSSLDTQVEVLHCIPLGVGKLKENQRNQAYRRTSRKQLQHVGSFPGRDFKQLMQILSHIIADEFTNPCVDKDLLLLNEALIVLGKLCSLLFVRKVESDFEAYVECIKTTVEDLPEKILVFHRDTNNPHPFSTSPKVHYLHHLHDDIRHFGCALHFETEKDEMFNKFIREQLFHTNRGNPPKMLLCDLQTKQP